MIDATHTPGPWKRGVAGHVIGSDGQPVAEATGPGLHDRTLAERDANARLIAAGPDMLAALDAYLRGDDDAVVRMRAAVARARGTPEPRA